MNLICYLQWIKDFTTLIRFTKFYFGIVITFRSQMFFKVGVLKNLANFTGKPFCWSLFLIKLQPEGIDIFL